ncbi:MAG: sigma-70 family RNA polymerase sigma factor [bacterium]|nr:sigma-70 family RNA polymerase sigma factor [bacterium]
MKTEVEQRGESPDERALRERAQRGDTVAFGLLVEGTMRRAYHVALGLVGSREDALDLSQDAFVRAFRARRSLDPARPFYPWYYQILRRLCFNFLRDQKLRRSKLESAAPWLIENANHRESTHRPDRAAERSALRRRLQAAIATLPDREREVFVLREFEGLRYAEVAELAGIPIGTVMSRLYSARRRLATTLEEER